MIMWKEFNSVVDKMLHKQHFVPGKGLCVLRKIPEYREYRIEDRLGFWDCGCMCGRNAENNSNHHLGFEFTHECVKPHEEVRNLRAGRRARAAHVRVPRGAPPRLCSHQEDTGSEVSFQVSWNFSWTLRCMQI